MGVLCNVVQQDVELSMRSTADVELSMRSAADVELSMHSAADVELSMRSVDSRTTCNSGANSVPSGSLWSELCIWCIFWQPVEQTVHSVYLLAAFGVSCGFGVPSGSLSPVLCGVVFGSL